MPLTATATAVSRPKSAAKAGAKAKIQTRTPGERLHRFLVMLAASAAFVLVVSLSVIGFSYYRLPLVERPFSPLHPYLRSSGVVGLRLGILGAVLFGILFVYPLRKRWKWLSDIGKTRRWLNFHALTGMTAPVVITFHATFRAHGLAGLAYWIMLSVALSGFIGRYIYAKIPRRLNSVKLTMAELEAEMAALAAESGMRDEWESVNSSILPELPSAEEIRRMNLLRVLWTMLRLDLMRPIQTIRLRRRLLGHSARIFTLGGLLRSRNAALEAMISNFRRQSRLASAAAFLHRTERVFHLWHVIHRPFSFSFLALVLIHIAVALSVGFN